ncbi:SDR family oxidoreductase [Sulfidibacter corallicola]|uniref:SDR family oxidoreductase n=1 Tax=Sulfidibacter corallicola TaxID=2818388 RepID=A0A8A4TNN5_SULCO|nr:SDR family oxidoreductase [Sulfidibacter corallicola]QTD51160.1 SDR family oxidoreductase [Sulfidibacter corallicola]
MKTDGFADLEPPISPFRDKVALVTGAASGIGAATARAFAARGAAVALCDLDCSGGSEMARSIEEAGGTAEFIEMDVANEASVARAFGILTDRFGGLDYAFNNAGICGSPTLFLETEAALFQRIFEINVGGVWRCMKHEAVLMETGGGAIVNAASVSGLKGFDRFSSYSASKHAVVGLTRSVAIELAGRGIRVNAVCPGVIDTPMVAGAGDEVLQRALAKVPMRRMGTPREVAAAVLHLCHPDSGFTTGQVLVMDGGGMA